MKQEKIWGLVILVLFAFAVLIVIGRPIRVAGHTILGSHPTKYGLDIKGGVRAILQAHPERAPGVPYDQATVQRILENRINAAGVGEAVVQPRPQEKQFIIELPDVKNKDAIMSQLGTTAQMTFYYFGDVQSPRNSSAPLQATTSKTAIGHVQYAFTVTSPWNGFHPGENFRDGAQIKADWAALLTEAMKNEPGAGVTAYAPPPTDPAQAQILHDAYDSLTANTGAPLYLTPAQQQRAAALNREYHRLERAAGGCAGGQRRQAGRDRGRPGTEFRRASEPGERTGRDAAVQAGWGKSLRRFHYRPMNRRLSALSWTIP